MEIRKKGTLVLFSLGIAGCQFPAEIKPYWDSTLKTLNALWVTATGSEKGKGPESPRSQGSEHSSQPEGDPDVAITAQEFKANAETLREIFQVVYVQEPTDRSEFASWMNTLSQGASFEGVYNGLIHSDDYRQLEDLKNKSASPRALRAFAEELAYLELQLSTPTQFDELSNVSQNPSEPPRVIDFSANRPSPTPTVSLGPIQPEGTVNPGEFQFLVTKYEKAFVVCSIFKLKKILGEEALRVFYAKRNYPEGLALWYSKWVVRIAKRNIDFGVALRNKPDEEFHYKWALQASEDRVKWEVLNRLHRVLNEADRLNP